jgi:hypothetical protein
MICFSYSLRGGGVFLGALGSFANSFPLAPTEVLLTVGELGELLAPDDLVVPLPFDSLRSAGAASLLFNRDSAV